MAGIKQSKSMHQNKDIRGFREECCQEVAFNSVTINGNADCKQEYPGSFDVYLTLSMLNKLKRR